jgi:hypothetical protein
MSSRLDPHDLVAIPRRRGRTVHTVVDDAATK